MHGHRRHVPHGDVSRVGSYGARLERRLGDGEVGVAFFGLGRLGVEQTRAKCAFARRRKVLFPVRRRWPLPSGVERGAG